MRDNDKTEEGKVSAVFDDTPHMTYYLIVAGTRTFDNYEYLKDRLDVTLNSLQKDFDEVVIVSGGAKGADALGEQYAREKGLEVFRMPAEWQKHGRAAGPIRNREMSELAHEAVIFWNGKSAGSANMIEQMSLRKKPYIIWEYGEEQCED